MGVSRLPCTGVCDQNNKSAIKRQESPELLPSSRLFLKFVRTKDRENADSQGAIGILHTYMTGKTVCPVVLSEEAADFLVELQLIKDNGRQAKIRIKHLKSGKYVYESPWRVGQGGPTMIFYGSPSRMAVSKLFNNDFLPRYEGIIR